MKNTYVYSIIIVFSVFFTVSCDKQLEEEYFSQYGPGNFPSGSTVENMLAENYNDFGTLVANNHRLWWATEFPTPSVHYQFRANHERNNLSMWNWNNSFTDPAYFEIMDMIWASVRTSNDIISLVPQVQMEDTQRQAEIVAEAKFLRAMVYFYGVRLWGGMPIIDKPQTLEDDLYPVRATIAETYAFIVQDLKDAIADLGTRSEFATRGIAEGHVTKQAAIGTLAKVYITMAGQPLADSSNLGEAKTLLDSIITGSYSGDYSLVQAGGGKTAYENLWDWQNPNNSEMMFSVQKLDAEIQSYRGMFGYFTPNVLTSGVWTSGDSDKYSKGSALDGVPPEFALWYESHDSGPRYEWTIITEFILDEDKDAFQKGDLYTMLDGPQAQAYIGKYRAVGAALTSNFFCPNDVPVLRYADVLLLHSEVTNELDVPDYNGLNAVRQRAGLSALSGLSKDDFRDAVFLERDLELTYEQNMLFDMRRRGLAYCKSKLEGFYNPTQNNYPMSFGGLTIEAHRLLYPYPPRELSANPNLVQNPGYPQ